MAYAFPDLSGSSMNASESGRAEVPRRHSDSRDHELTGHANRHIGVHPDQFDADFQLQLVA
jgi:hypothetical protein